MTRDHMLILRIPASQVSTPDVNNTLALKLGDELNVVEGRVLAFRVNRLAEIFRELFRQRLCLGCQQVSPTDTDAVRIDISVIKILRCFHLLFDHLLHAKFMMKTEKFHNKLKKIQTLGFIAAINPLAQIWLRLDMHYCPRPSAH